MGGFTSAFKAFTQILFKGEHAEGLELALQGKPLVAEPPKMVAPEKPQEKPVIPTPAPTIEVKEVQPPAPPPVSNDSVYTLVLLQREGRLIDFLQEDIAAYEDDQIGAAVREIHGKCQATLKKHFDIHPIRDEAEGEDINVPSGFDATEIQLTGNVRGEPPMRGTVRHRGWRVKKIALPERNVTVNPKVIYPCEVEFE